MLDYLISYLPIAFTAIIITCVMELFVAFLFRIENYKVIIAANVTTQVFLHIVISIAYKTGFMFNNQYTIYGLYAAIELIVLVSEFLIYSKFIGNRKKSFLAMYSLSANLVSYLTGNIINVTGLALFLTDFITGIFK